MLYEVIVKFSVEEEDPDMAEMEVEGLLADMFARYTDHDISSNMVSIDGPEANYEIIDVIEVEEEEI